MPTARPFYWPQQQQTCWHRPPLNGHGTVVVDEDLYSDFLSIGVYFVVSPSWRGVPRLLVEFLRAREDQSSSHSNGTEEQSPDVPTQPPVE
jgi:hypothetical protein